MYPTKNTLPETIRSQIVSLLQEHLASELDMGSYAKQAHWNVKGPDFIALHELFDKIHEEAEEGIDLIAERIVQLGGIAVGTIRMVAKRTHLPEYPAKIATGQEHVTALAISIAAYSDGIRKAGSKAEEIKHADTADILTEISRGMEKYLWFVEAHLQAAR